MQVSFNSLEKLYPSDTEEETTAILNQLSRELEEEALEAKASEEKKKYIPLCNVDQNHWLSLPIDIPRYLLQCFSFSYNEIMAFGLTCKTWYECIKFAPIGAVQLKKVGLGIRENELWLTTYRLWKTCQNHFIILDVSGSMNTAFDGGESRLADGRRNVLEVAGKLLPVAYRGLRVILFSDAYSVKHCHTLEEVTTHITNLEINQGGTNILQVFKGIFKWHKNQSLGTEFGEAVPKATLSNVYLISDMDIEFDEDIERELRRLSAFEAPIVFQCHRIDHAQAGTEFTGRLLGYNQENSESPSDEEGAGEINSDLDHWD